MKRLIAARRRLLVLGAVASVAIVAASVYGYGALADTSQSYSACLKNGVLSNVVIDGTGPAPVCPHSAVLIGWSQSGPQGPSGATGQTGQTGATGPAGSAVAYAHVGFDGTVDASRSKNITQAMVTHPQPGVYCFDNLGFTPKNVVATIGGIIGVGSGPSVPEVIADIPSFSICDTQAEVGMVDPSTGAFSRDASFYVAFN